MTSKTQNKSPKTTTTELPVVVLGKPASPDNSAQIPIVRMLQGRVSPSVVFYPIYTLLLISGFMTTRATLSTGEWSAGIITITWIVLFTWHWIYLVAWNYRKNWLRRFSCFMGWSMNTLVAFFCLDRADPQIVWTVSDGLIRRPELASLRWSSTLLFICLVLWALHVLFLGRGYRQKTATS